MNEILHANIFFFITGIAVIVCTFLLVIVLFHLIKILRAVGRIVDRVEAGTATIAEDIEQLRTYVVEETFLGRFMKGVRRKEEGTKEEPLARRTPLRTLKPERKQKTELKIKNEG